MCIKKSLCSAINRNSSINLLRPELPRSGQPDVLRVQFITVCEVGALTLVRIVLGLQLQLFPLQLQKLHLYLQVLLLSFQGILKFNEFLMEDTRAKIGPSQSWTSISRLKVNTD